MPEFVTKSELRGFARNLNLFEQDTLRKSAENRSADNSTFLSHSSRDEDLVVGAIKLLENHGATVYVDKKDVTLPPYTNKQTAGSLKSRIRKAHKFVLLATNNSRESKWVPWELGVADGYKSLEGIALLPAVDNAHETVWPSWEYLGLYNRIVWGKLEGYSKELWMVFDEDKRTATRLVDWLK